MAHVDNNLSLTLHGGAQTARYIRQTFLQKEVQGFVGSEYVAFKITVHDGPDISISYYVYQGGEFFIPRIPAGQANPISIDLLPLDAFVKGLPAFQLTNAAYLSWVADSVIVKDFTVTGSVLQIHFVQSNPYSKIQDFTKVASSKSIRVRAQTMEALTPNSQLRTMLVGRRRLGSGTMGMMFHSFSCFLVGFHSQSP